MILKGPVVQGCKHFQTRMTKFREVIKEATGQELFPGTLNVRIDREIKIQEEFRIQGTKIGEPEQDLLFERCRINGIDAYRIRPWNVETGLGGHGDDTLEIACSQKIADVAVGTEVEIELHRDESDS